MKPMPVEIPFVYFHYDRDTKESTPVEDTATINVAHFSSIEKYVREDVEYSRLNMHGTPNPFIVPLPRLELLALIMRGCDDA